MTREETLDKIKDLKEKKTKLEQQTRKVKAELDKLETEAVEKGYGMWVFSFKRKIVPNRQRGVCDSKCPRHGRGNAILGLLQQQTYLEVY